MKKQVNPDAALRKAVADYVTTLEAEGYSLREASPLISGFRDGWKIANEINQELADQLDTVTKERDSARETVKKLNDSLVRRDYLVVCRDKVG
jgi:hypothetical protein